MPRPGRPYAGKGLMTTETAKIPVGVRLKAWWEGYSADDLWDATKEEPAEDGPDENGDASAAPKSADSPPGEPRKPKGQILPWDDKRLEIAQFVWGEGYCGPGGPEHVVAMAKILALTPEMSVLGLGGDLGGPARTLAKETGAWISCLESSQDMVDAGNKLSEKAGLSKKAKLKFYNFDKPMPLDRQYDRVFSKESLFTVPDKKNLFETLEPFIKGDALVLLTDYVIASEADLNSKEIREWKKGEPKEPFLSTSEQLVNAVKDGQLSIRVSEDISDQYIKLIAESWANADKLIAQLMERGDEGQELVDTLLTEAEFWSRRSKLLVSGKLKVWRIVAHKKVLQSLMSNW